MQQEIKVRELAEQFFKDEIKKLDDPQRREEVMHEEETYIGVWMLGFRAGEQHPGASVWVKCSDRLPGHKKRVKWRDGNDHSYVTDGEISLFEMDKPYLDGWEWYDETGQSNRDDAVVEIERRNKLLENNLKLGIRLNRPGISDQEQEDTWQDYKRRNSL